MATEQITTRPSPLSVVERLQMAQNQHNLEAFLDCFDSNYHSEQPVHPDRAFQVIKQVRKNWSTIFSGVPDFRSELLRTATEGDTGWAEWRWSGTHPDRRQFEMQGVTIFGVRDNQIVWERLYMEPVHETGAGIDAQMQTWDHGARS